MHILDTNNGSKFDEMLNEVYNLVSKISRTAH